MKYHVDLGILGEEVAIEVEFTSTPYTPATRDDPAEGGEIDILVVICEKYPALEGVIADHLQDDEAFLSLVKEQQEKDFIEARDAFLHALSVMREMDEA